jgi:hypothetical protein
MTSADVRLVGALEELILAETLALRAQDVARAVQAQRRAAPLITALAGLQQAGQLAADLLPRLHEVAARRQQNQMHVAAMKARLLPELERLQTARRRLNIVRPVYGPRKRRTTLQALA